MFSFKTKKIKTSRGKFLATRRYNDITFHFGTMDNKEDAMALHDRGVRRIFEEINSKDLYDPVTFFWTSTRMLLINGSTCLSKPGTFCKILAPSKFFSGRPGLNKF
jgi:hypothetical protein